MRKEKETAKNLVKIKLSGLISYNYIGRPGTLRGRVAYDSGAKSFVVAVGDGYVRNLSNLMAKDRLFERAIKKACRPYTTIETLSESNARPLLDEISIIVAVDKGNSIVDYELSESYKAALGPDLTASRKVRRSRILESNEDFAVF